MNELSNHNGNGDHQQPGFGFGLIAPRNSTGIKVIIVGAGFAGLACAIECRRKGHDVLVLEKFSELKVLVERWGLGDTLWALCGHPDVLHLHNYKGDEILTQTLIPREFGSASYNGHRGEIHQLFFDYATKELGIEVRLGQVVTEYWEEVEAGKAGVIVNGERMEADVVVGADGVKSKARELVLGYEDAPKSSGYAIYRAWFNAQENGVDKDPLTSFLCQGKDVFYGWIGQDVHMLTSSNKGGTAISWVITHKDDADIRESWSFPGHMPDVLAVVKGWDPRCAAILSKAPSCVDWKLVYRDPLKTWISPGARLALIGDAAHPFLPTSVQGASQAIEDGVTLAAVLQLSRKDEVPLAVQTWEKIRYQRVRNAQLLGESTRDKWHKAKAEDRGEDMAMPRPEWVFAFDAEKYAYEAYEGVVGGIRENGYELPKLP